MGRTIAKTSPSRNPAVGNHAVQKLLFGIVIKITKMNKTVKYQKK
jgi:hypothetical protein